MQMFIFPVVAHWLWSPLGWASAYAPSADLLFGVGALDFAGGAVVHLLAATIGLVACKLLGFRNQFVDVQTREANKADEFVPRYEKDDTGKWKMNVLKSTNPLIGALGVFILFFGWFGFNGGSLITIVERSGGTMTSRSAVYGRVLINTMMAGGIGSLMAFLVGRWYNRNQIYFKWSLNDMLNGLLAGLVCITPAAAYVDVWHSIWFGIIAAFIYKCKCAQNYIPDVDSYFL
jgi:Amt family ammonium transporter